MTRKFLYFEALPNSIFFEIERICSSRAKTFSDVSEIRLRAFGKNEIRLGMEKIRLSSEISEEEIVECLSRLCGGSLYAFRDSIANGYISLDGGIRVGISGVARYDGGALVGIGEISSLVFRIPTERSEILEELISAWKRTVRAMIIYSPPGLGKTTALRSLVGYLGGSGGCEVAVIDERLEFLPSDYKNCSVDILRGYKRSIGMQIALRSMSPDVMVIDELGCEDEVFEILNSVNTGVRIVATAHAGSLEELMRRKNMKPLIDAEVFDVFLGIKSLDGSRSVKIDARQL